jgi:hypothetical protein
MKNRGGGRRRFHQKNRAGTHLATDGKTYSNRKPITSKGAATPMAAYEHQRKPSRQPMSQNDNNIAGLRPARSA